MSNETRSVCNPPSTEAEISDRLVSGISAWRPDALEREVRSHGRARTDIVYYADGFVVAVEVKRGDWRRAIGQAMLNRLVADRSYIALWSTKISPTILDEARHRQIGVIAVDDDAVSIIEAAPPCRPDQRVRSRILTHVMGS